MPVKTKKLSVLIVDDPLLNKREDSGLSDGNARILAPHGAGNNDNDQSELRLIGLFAERSWCPGGTKCL
jgi:hypothetical protein